MHLNGGALGFAIAALPMIAVSELITVTEYPSVCSAIYTSGQSSATVVLSTVTVTPTPFSDALINDGTPFAVEIQPIGPASRKRQAASSTFLDAQGYTTTDPDKAVLYRISNGTLSATTGGSVTADSDDMSVAFAISSVLGSIRTQFLSQDLSLQWNNAAFNDGAAEFFIVPVGNNTQRVVAYLDGELEESWIAVNFALRPTGGLVIESSTSVGSTTISTVISMGSMSSAPTASATITSGSVPASGSGSASGPIASSTAATSSIAVGVSSSAGIATTATVSPSSGIASASASPSPTPSGNVSPDGRCGTGTGFNCWGADNGNCCSPYGFCGGNTDRDLYCGDGCQSEYGDCDVTTTSSTVVSSAPAAESSSWASTTIVSLSTSGSVTYSVTITPSSSAAQSTWQSPPVSLSTSNGVTYSVTVTPSSSWTTWAETIPSYSGSASPIVPEPTSTISWASETPSFILVSSESAWASSSWSSSASSAEPSIASIMSPSSPSWSSSWYSTAAEIPSSVAVSSSAIVPSSAAPILDYSMSSSTISTAGLSVGVSSPVVSPIASSTEVLSSTLPSESSTAVSSTSSSLTATISLAVPSSASTTNSLAAASSVKSLPASSSPVLTSSNPSSSPVASSSSTESSSSGGSSSTWLVLGSPTPCNFGDPMDMSEDDTYCEIDLPQAMTVYSASDTKTYACTNGFLSILTGSSQYQTDPLPSTNIPANSVVPFFDDLAIFGGQAQRQGIYYQLTPSGVTYEYYLARAGVINELYHFTVGYNYSTPGVFVYTYYSVGNGNNGKFASVGVQGNNAGGTLVGYQYAFDSTDITPGLVITCDTVNNVCASNAPGY